LPVDYKSLAKHFRSRKHRGVRPIISVVVAKKIIISDEKFDIIFFYVIIKTNRRLLMYIIKLNDDRYLVSVGRVRLWEPVSDAQETPHMHFYDSGYKAVKEKEKATLFSDLVEVDIALNNEALQILYPDAKAEEL
jgi:hypothetical protein